MEYKFDCPEEYDLYNFVIKVEYKNDLRLEGLYSIKKNCYIIQSKYKDIGFIGEYEDQPYIECVKSDNLSDIYNPFCEPIIKDVQFFTYYSPDVETDETFCFIFMKDHKIGLLRHNFEIINELDAYIEFNEGLAPISLYNPYNHIVDGKLRGVGYIDREGVFKIKPSFQSAGKFENGVAKVIPQFPICGRNTCYALINKFGVIVKEEECRCSPPHSKGRWYL